MTAFTIKKGSTLPKLRAQLTTSTGSAVDLTGATVTLRMRSSSGGEKIAAGTVTVVTAARGIVEYAWQAGDTDTVGTFNAEFVATYSNGVQIVPSAKYVQVVVTASLA